MKKAIVLIILIGIFVVPCLAKPTDWEQLRVRLSNPGEYLKYSGYLAGFNNPSDTSLLVRYSNNHVYAFKEGTTNGQKVLVVGRHQSPSTTLYATEEAIGKLLDNQVTGNNWFCLVQYEMENGRLGIKGSGARWATLFIKSACQYQLANNIPIPTIPRWNCDDLAMGKQCGKNACGWNTQGTCQQGLICNVNNICWWDIPPQQKENGEICNRNDECQSTVCYWDAFFDLWLCDGPRQTGMICQHGGECISRMCEYAGGQGPMRRYVCG
ncbi:hypothetical protein ACFLZN_00410 [Nanoarchaeota archaeon]